MGTMKTIEKLFILLLVSQVIIFSKSSLQADENETVDSLIQKSIQEYRAGKTKEAIAQVTRLIKKNPENAKLISLRARMYEQNQQFQKAIDDYSIILKLKPEDTDFYHQRGVCYFNLGEFKKSVEDFDQFLKDNPGYEPRHWQRGISHYYAKMYSAGRKQFETHQTVNSQDVENAVWHFLCVARDESIETASKELIPIQGDTRIPMMKVHELFMGKATVADVLAKAEQGAGKIPDSQLKVQRFYAHLYLGLYYEAYQKMDLAKKHIHLAATKYSIQGYMGNVARVHHREYQKRMKIKKKD